MKAVPFIRTSFARWWWAGLWGLCLALVVGANSANGAVPGETEVKAVYLYKFAKFVEWPARAFADTSAPVIIGVFGSNPIGDVLVNVVANETVGGRRFEIRRFAPGEDVSASHVLFVSAAEREHWPALHRALGTNAVLTVSDLDRFTERGGMIEFFKVKNTIRFNIQPSAAARCGLSIRSQLLRLSQSRPAE